jgi:MerR family transcriptional regulator, copper efflux regulator
MKIGDVARQAGISVRAIRYYEKLGLIQASRTAGGYRDFDEGTATLVRRIRRMIRLGFTTAEIATFLNCIVDDPAQMTACASVAAAHRRKLAEIERQIAELEERRDRLIVTLKAASGQNPSAPEIPVDQPHDVPSFRPHRDAGFRRLLRRRG